jgi:hypothetical protein
MTSNRLKTQGKAVCGHCGEASGGLWGLFDDVHGQEAIAAGIALRRRINDLRSVPCDTLTISEGAQVTRGRGVRKPFWGPGGKRVARPSAKKRDQPFYKS